MAHLNVEIKARCGDPEAVQDALVEGGAEHHGRDHQIDTYFVCQCGRLKLRQGTLETALIHYDRPDVAGARPAAVELYHPVGAEQAGRLRTVLEAAMDTRIVVDKRREIYYAGNVKFHVDDVTGLGRFVEIEAIDVDGELGEDTLRQQVDRWMETLGIREDDLVAESYSDLLMK
jgi:predicted adenylyl cyclase CyaB